MGRGGGGGTGSSRRGVWGAGTALGVVAASGAAAAAAAGDGEAEVEVGMRADWIRAHYGGTRPALSTAGFISSSVAPRDRRVQSVDTLRQTRPRGRGRGRPRGRARETAREARRECAPTQRLTCVGWIRPGPATRCPYPPFRCTCLRRPGRRWGAVGAGTAANPALGGEWASRCAPWLAGSASEWVRASDAA